MIYKESNKMTELRIELNSFKETQQEFNQTILNRFVLIDERIKKLEDTNVYIILDDLNTLTMNLMYQFPFQRNYI